MHIGVKEAVVKYLRKKYLNATLCQGLHVDAGVVERADVANGYAGNPLRDHKSGCAVVPEDGRHKYQFASGCVFLEQRRISRFSA